MSRHCLSVFANSCLNVPRDPLTKMPIAQYERNKQKKIKKQISRSSIDSTLTEDSIIKSNIHLNAKEFYESIPDYQELHHLPEQQFYLTLQSLRRKKREMLGLSITDLANEDVPIEHLDIKIKNKFDDNGEEYRASTPFPKRDLKYSSSLKPSQSCAEIVNLRDLSSDSKKPHGILTHEREKINKKTIVNAKYDQKSDVLDTPVNKGEISFKDKIQEVDKDKMRSDYTDKEQLDRSDSRNKVNPSACSITWSDKCNVGVYDIDAEFDKYFNSTGLSPYEKDRKSQSLPSSPIRSKRSPKVQNSKRNGITIPKPFKMTKRDEDEKEFCQLKRLTKSFSAEMLDRKYKKTKKFHARPVPIESRIPLYDKILQDQAMRSAITKINSLADMQAQMKPFSFTERDDQIRRNRLCAAPSTSTTPSEKSKKKKKFKARPVPKNLFSNYVYDKMKEDAFYRSMNKRIRAEELLRSCRVPSVATRTRSRMSTPGAHSDLPTDTNSDLGSDVLRANSKNNGFITSSPQPFILKTSSRTSRRKSTKSPTKMADKPASSEKEARPLSALDVRSVNRSNLAAVLRIENTKKKLEDDLARRIAEQKLRAEQRWRDHVLRKKPAWKLVKNDYEEDIALRLQTRREEERLRREEFLHEMELMHSRVRQQPMLFERYYSPTSRPHSYSSESLTLQISPTKVKLHKKSPKKVPKEMQRKVSINDIAETIDDDFFDYLNKENNESKFDTGSEVTESVDDGCK